MIGPKVEDIKTNEKRPNYIVEESGSRAKRKLFDDVIKSLNLGDTKTMCIKKRHLHEDDIIVGSSHAKVEVIVVDGKWDTSQTIPSIVGEMHDVSFQNLDSVSNSAPWSDSNGIKCSPTTNSGFFQQNCQVEIKSETDIDCSTDSLSFSDMSSTTFNESNCRYASDDNEALNLSWLLNFKVDSLFHPNDIEHDHSYPGSDEDFDNNEGANAGKRTKLESNKIFLSDSKGSVERLQSQHSSIKLFHSRYNGPKKPPFTYTELIEQALREKGELTVSGIYNWISEHFPFYKANDDRWKNSVRHNLSINPHFRKGCKASQGAGHLWTVAHKDNQARYSMKKQQRIHEFMSDIVTLEEVAAATASIEENKENRNVPLDAPTLDTNPSTPEVASFAHQMFSSTQGVSLEQSAGEILSGVKKEVEVQYLIPIRGRSPQKTDFLNPVSKDVIVQESGLLDRVGDLEGSFLITDLNPVALELNMADTEIITPDNLFPDDIGFQYYEYASSSAQLQV